VASDKYRRPNQHNERNTTLKTEHRKLKATSRISRRKMIVGASAGALAVAAVPTPVRAAASAPAPSAQPTFRFGLNTSTLRGQKLPLAELVDVAAKAGFQALEPWISELEAHAHSGGSLKDLGRRIQDLGMSVESAIGFAEWIVNDDTRRAKGLEQAKRDMDLVRQIGGVRIAAPPAGATQVADLDLAKAAERYRTLLEAGEQIGVIPQVEVWGFSKSLRRLSEAATVALDCGHPAACVLPDVFHLYKGGSNFAGLRLLSGNAIHVIHTNDYPNKSRSTIVDADRVFPGDGVAPLAQVFRDLHDAGFRGTLSIELFNPTYWQQDPKTVARTALEKTRALVADAIR
jgi:sugar phosphate isomerase/epimerase